MRVDSIAPEMAVSKRLHVGDVFGEGGMSFIEVAYDSNLQREVARKVLKPEFAADESVCGRLIEEAQITAQLDHPNVVPVYELGEDRQKKLYFTMKLVRGRTFSEIIAERDPRQRTEKDLFDQLQVFLKVCDAVAFAHHRGVIHQDLKPDNIMVGEFGEVYLMDWGFALPKKAEKARPGGKRREYAVNRGEGFVSTTIYYMEPEQAKADPRLVDARTDVYCLGGILYKILTHRPPHFGDTIQDAARSAIHGTIVPPAEATDVDLPERLVRICAKALSPDPALRYQTALELKADVERFLQCGWQFEREQFAAGHLIIREGDAGDAAYVITTGRCRVFKTVVGEKVVVGELGPGDVFGELAVFAGQPRGASVEAIEPVTAMVVTRRHFEEDLGMSFWLGLCVKALAERFLESSRRVTELEHELSRAGWERAMKK